MLFDSGAGISVSLSRDDEVEENIFIDIHS